MKEILRRQNSAAISHQVSPASLLNGSAGNCRGALMDESGIIINLIGDRTDQRRSRCNGRLVCPPHSNSCFTPRPLYPEERTLYQVIFQALTAASMKTAAFWGTVPCSLEARWRFGSAITPLYPLQRRMGGSHSRYGRWTKTIMPFQESNPAAQTAAWSFHWLSCPGFSIVLKETLHVLTQQHQHRTHTRRIHEVRSSVHTWADCWSGKPRCVWAAKYGWLACVRTAISSLNDTFYKLVLPFTTQLEATFSLACCLLLINHNNKFNFLPLQRSQNCEVLLEL
jgi:hypothetical protein